jgi:putative flippase GtrA
MDPKVLEKFKKLSPEFRKYLIVGISVYVFELLIIVIAQQAGASAIVAVGLSFWLGLSVSFLFQKFLTFGDKRVHHKILIPQIAAYSLLVFFNFGFTIIVTSFLVSLIPAVVARTLAIGVTTLWNFYLYKTRIFKTTGTPLID